MSEPRNPFEYVSWCDGPSVDISPLAEFPLCTQIEYNVPKFHLHHVAMTIPDLAPPPMCPCIWSIDASYPGYADITFTGISAPEASAHMRIKPRSGEDQDCCNPSFDIEFSLKLPCFAFETSVTGTMLGTVTANLDAALIRDFDNCVLRLSYALSLPALAQTVLVSIRLDPSNGFQVYKKTLLVYREISDDGWHTIIPVGSCTVTS